MFGPGGVRAAAMIVALMAGGGDADPFRGPRNPVPDEDIIYAVGVAADQIGCSRHKRHELAVQADRGGEALSVTLFAGGGDAEPFRGPGIRQGTPRGQPKADGAQGRQATKPRGDHRARGIEERDPLQGKIRRFRCSLVALRPRCSPAPVTASRLNYIPSDTQIVTFFILAYCTRYGHTTNV